MFELKVKTHFDAAHFLKDYDGKCNREHGHRWDVQVCMTGTYLDKCNMLIDFSIVKSVVKDLMDNRLDHYQLNEALGEHNPTAEYLSWWIYDQLEPVLAGQDMALTSVTVWESPECSVEYFGEEVDEADTVEEEPMMELKKV